MPVGGDSLKMTWVDPRLAGLAKTHGNWATTHLKRMSLRLQAGPAVEGSQLCDGAEMVGSGAVY